MNRIYFYKEKITRNKLVSKKNEINLQRIASVTSEGITYNSHYNSNIVEWAIKLILFFLGGVLLVLYLDHSLTEYLWSGQLPEFISLSFSYPVVREYSNLVDKSKEALNENKNKAGVYMFINKVNGKKYVGSSVNLRTRFGEYFNPNYWLRKEYMVICRAIVKYGLVNFYFSSSWVLWA